MGQRTVSTSRPVSKLGQKSQLDEFSQPELSIFSTEVGWCGLLGASEIVERLFMGHHSKTDVRAAVKRCYQEDHTDFVGKLEESDWYPELRERLQAYFRGAIIEFQDIEIRLPRLTAFQGQVIHALKKVGYGKQVTYGELASLAGAPRAARAVGTVMSSNRIPIIIPCHRVVASGGKLGGFSAPQGTSLKEHLLSLESQAAE